MTTKPTYVQWITLGLVALVYARQTAVHNWLDATVWLLALLLAGFAAFKALVAR